MVKFGPSFVSPPHVMAVGLGENGAGSIIHMAATGVTVTVVGMTPDEVHAKLFPQSRSNFVVSDGGAAMMVLVALSDEPTKDWSLDDIKFLARKALGREEK